MYEFAKVPDTWHLSSRSSNWSLPVMEFLVAVKEMVQNINDSAMFMEMLQLIGAL
jgi:hypothetical protein